MGKKSRRPKRNKPKDIPAAASSPSVASPQDETSHEETSATDNVVDNLVIGTFNQLAVSQDWEGLLELESKMSVIANIIESSDPRHAGSINFMLGMAHFEIGTEGDIEQGIVYYKKTIELAKKAEGG